MITPSPNRKTLMALFLKDGTVSATAIELATVIAGQLAANLSRNAVLTGTPEYVVALSSLRIANAIHLVADLAGLDNSLLDIHKPVGPMIEAVEKRLKERQAELDAEAAMARPVSFKPKRPTAKDTEPTELVFDPAVPEN